MQYIIMIAAFLILAAYVVAGLLRGTKKGLIRLGFLAVSAVLSFFLAKWLSGSFGALLIPKLQEWAATVPEIAGFFEQTGDLQAAVGAIAQMLAGPLLFLVCYVLLALITWGIQAVLCFILRIKADKEKMIVRVIGGAATGLLAGVIGVFVFITPVVGYTQLASETVVQADALTAKLPELGLEEYNEKYLAPAANTPGISQLYSGLGAQLFGSLTRAEWEGQTVELETEWFALIGAANEAAQLVEKPVEEYGDAEADTLHRITDRLGQSELLCELGSYAVSEVATAWLEGRAYMGIAKPEIEDESVQLIFHALLTVMSESDAENFSGDMDFIADLIGLFIKKGVLKKMSEGETEDLIAYLVSSGLLQEVGDLFGSYQRMKPINDAIGDAAMRLLVKQLGDPDTYLEKYEDLMDDVSGALKNATDAEGNVNVEALTESMSTTLAEHNIEVPEEATEIIADVLAEEFAGEDLSSLPISEITNRLIGHLNGLPDLDQAIADAEQAA